MSRWFVGDLPVPLWVLHVFFAVFTLLTVGSAVSLIVTGNGWFYPLAVLSWFGMRNSVEGTE